MVKPKVGDIFESEQNPDYYYKIKEINGLQIYYDILSKNFEFLNHSSYHTFWCKEYHILEVKTKTIEILYG